MTLDSILNILSSVVDIAIIWVIFYFILKKLRNNMKLGILFKGLIIILVVKVISDWLGLLTTGLVLDYIIAWGPLAIIVIFQPEIRAALEQLGRSNLLGSYKTLSFDQREELVYEIMEAVEYLKRNRMGSLIVIERNDSLKDYIEKSTKLYAAVSSELIISAFFPNNPLHKGGLIIQGDQIISAGATFPVTQSEKINKRLGARHRAAVGVTEITDAIVLIVSGDTGHVSLAIDGQLSYNLSLDDTKMRLIDELRPKVTYIEDELDEEGSDSNA